MKVGIMGGTFDPIHTGHLIAAESARDAAGLDEIWFIPTHIPPHKGEHGILANPQQRLEMVTRVVEKCPYFKAVDIEIARGGISYTIDTAMTLVEQYEGVEFYYIIGADMIQYLPKWHRFEELLSAISFIGLERAGFHIEWDTLPAQVCDKVRMVPMPAVDISSTDIRNRRKNGKSIRYLVPDEALSYMEEQELYES